jgi:serine/threonine protein kinase/formylglycine-generating enzyme required for sulfatase activity
MRTEGPDFHARVREVFKAAQRLPADAREAFVRSECANEAAVRDEVLSLLHQTSGPIPTEMPLWKSESSEWSRLTRERIGTPPQPSSKFGDPKDSRPGGMGTVLFVWDRALQRQIAMKVAKGEELRGAAGFCEPDERLVERLMREAEITGRLEHPAIVPVHELALQTTGRVYFTMQLVRGRTYADALREGRGSKQAFPRLLAQLERVCQAVAYAHSRGVIHRDLKPANVMVGDFDTVYVMDWGLARVVDARRFQLDAPEAGTAPPELAPDLVGDAQPATAGARERLALDLTETGVGLGTPGYMSPEQARGERDRVGYSSDVYSAGALLYELLAGERPHVAPGSRPHAREVLESVLAGPPRPLREFLPMSLSDLITICERAMQREPAQRYASMREMAEDLRRVLEGRAPVVAGPNAWRDLRYWVRRNRGLAAAFGIAATALLAGAISYTRSEVLGEENERLWQEGRLIEAAEPGNAEFEVRPEHAPRFAAALRELDDLRPAAERVRRELDALRADGVPAPESPRSTALSIQMERAKELGSVLAKLAEYRMDRAAHGPDLAVLEPLEPSWRAYIARVEDSANLETRFDYARLGPTAALAARARERRLRVAAQAASALFAPLIGSRDHLARKLDVAQALAQEAAPAGLWDEAIASIGSPQQCPRYDGLMLVPQAGLTPLRRDPGSGLWEFWHNASGHRPLALEGSGYAIDADDGIVLILLPGGEYRMGSSPDEKHPEHSERKEELPQIDVQLSPYFVAKYELTQAQWWRMAGAWPSVHWAGKAAIGFNRFESTHPVENVSAEQAERVLDAYGLDLPTEAQWEAAARAGQRGRLALDQSREAAWKLLNAADPSFDAWRQTSASVAAGDGRALHAPVGQYAPDRNGLHDMLGNVSEWCSGDYTNGYSTEPRTARELPEARIADASTGALTARIPGRRVCRGGSFSSALGELQYTRRWATNAGAAFETVGLRAARSLQLRP